MKFENLKKANQLNDSILETEGAISEIEKWLEDDAARKSTGDVIGGASFYNLVLSSHGDASGHKAYLKGYHDNEKILKAVLDILRERLESYVEAFKLID